MFGLLYSCFLALVGLQISCADTQSLPNLFLFALPCSCFTTHLNSCLQERRLGRERLPRLKVGVVALLKLLLKVLQLLIIIDSIN